MPCGGAVYEAGLRSLGPVWSRSNAFRHGVPFLCPSSPDTGPGLTWVLPFQVKPSVSTANRCPSIVLNRSAQAAQRGFSAVVDIISFITDAMLCPTISLDSRAPLLRAWPCRCLATTSR